MALHNVRPGIWGYINEFKKVTKESKEALQKIFQGEKMPQGHEARKNEAKLRRVSGMMAEAVDD